MDLGYHTLYCKGRFWCLIFESRFYLAALERISKIMSSDASTSLCLRRLVLAMSQLYQRYRNRWTLVLLVLLVSLLSSFVLFRKSDAWDLPVFSLLTPLPTDSSAPSTFPPPKFKNAFISSALYSSVEGGFNETIVQAWCQSQTRWRQDVALDPIIYGGIGTSIFFTALTFQFR